MNLEQFRPESLIAHFMFYKYVFFKLSNSQSLYNVSPAFPDPILPPNKVELIIPSYGLPPYLYVLYGFTYIVSSFSAYEHEFLHLQHLCILANSLYSIISFYHFIVKGFVHVVGDYLCICKDPFLFQGLGYYGFSLE